MESLSLGLFRLQIKARRGRELSNTFLMWLDSPLSFIPFDVCKILRNKKNCFYDKTNKMMSTPVLSRASSKYCIRRLYNNVPPLITELLLKGSLYLEISLQGKKLQQQITTHHKQAGDCCCQWWWSAGSALSQLETNR